MFSPFIDLLVLILIANGSPVVARRLFRGNLNQPLDFGIILPDGYRLLGASKTWRGLLFSLLFTAMCSMTMNYTLHSGFLIALLSLSGDTFSSFIKRRLGKPSKSMFLLLDQIPESLLPAFFMAAEFNLAPLDVVYLVLMFIPVELALSRLMFRLGVREKPY
jgi:CDP-diglyceride synthetase